VRIDSEVGKGTRVTLYLPRAACESFAAAVTEEPQTAPRTDTCILVVEDNPDVTEVTSALVKHLGFQVRVAGDAETALRILEAENVGLVFSDIMMPGAMDGVALARAIRQRHPAMPVLLVSGSNKLVETAQQDFATLQKPYQPAELRRAISSLLGSPRAIPEQSNLVHLEKAKRRRGPKGSA
jgi:CheY-like chemotaxis protein